MIPQAVVEMENVSFSYDPEKPLLKNIDLTLMMDSRIGMLGANGVGKTTLVKLILGELTPQDKNGKPIDEKDANDPEKENEEEDEEKKATKKAAKKAKVKPGKNKPA